MLFRSIPGFSGNQVLRYTGPVALDFNITVDFKYGSYAFGKEGDCDNNCGGATPCQERGSAPHIINISKKTSTSDINVSNGWFGVDNRAFTFTVSDGTKCGAWSAGVVQQDYGDNDYTVTTNLAPGDKIIVSISPQSPYTGAAETDRKSTRLNSSHVSESRMPSSA